MIGHRGCGRACGLRRRRRLRIAAEVARDRVQVEHVAVSRQIEADARLVRIVEQHALDHRDHSRHVPGLADQRDRARVRFEVARFGLGRLVPRRNAHVEAMRELFEQRFVILAPLGLPVEIEQIQVGQREQPAGVVEQRLAHDLDGLVEVADADEEIGQMANIHHFVDLDLLLA